MNSVAQGQPAAGSAAVGRGALIINADDWGRDRKTTQAILDCILRGTVSATSAMVFMEDSERGAEIARASHVDTGLHINLTTEFSGTVSRTLKDRQAQVANFLLANKKNRILYHPGLANAFGYVVRAQIEEYTRLYGAAPARVDGHHHMHLATNVLLGGLLPKGTIARRNFTFLSGEKSAFNRAYRAVTDRFLAKRHTVTDYFFNLPPMDEPGRLERICGLAREHVVELETHPVLPEEYDVLMGEQIYRWTNGQPIEPAFRFPAARSAN